MKNYRLYLKHINTKFDLVYFNTQNNDTIELRYNVIHIVLFNYFHDFPQF